MLHRSRGSSPTHQSSHKNVILLASPGMNGCRLFIRPRNDYSLVGDLVVGRSCRAWILEGSAHMPFVMNTAL